MVYASFFNVIRKYAEGTDVFNMVSKKFYHFPLSWEEITEAVREDEMVREQLIEVGLFSTKPGYMEQLDDYFRRLEQEDNRNLVVYFCVTSRCGVGCSYCFQNHTNRTDSSEYLVDRFLELLERRLARAPVPPIFYLVLFGGEAIRREDLCCRLLEGASSACRRHSVILKAYLAANGICEREENLLPLKERGLSGIQVTFDGPEAIHRKTRGDTYTVAMSMLPHYERMFNLSIKYNLTRNSVQAEHIAEFLDDVSTSGVARDTLIVPEAVVPTITYKDDSVLFNYNDTDLPSAFREFFNQASRRGLRATLSSAFHPPCFLRRRNVLEIQPDGIVTCCENGYGLEEFIYGNIGSMEELTPAKPHISGAMRRAAEEKCMHKRCPFFPLCESGCFMVKYMKNVPFHYAECHREYFENFFPFLFEVFSKRESTPKKRDQGHLWSETL